MIDRLATQVWEIRDHKLITFKGTYREYILRRAAPKPGANGHKILLAPKPMVRDNSKETKRRTLALEQLETRIREQEAVIQRLSRELEKAGQKQSFERMQTLSWQVAHAQSTLDQLIGEWERLVA